MVMGSLCALILLCISRTEGISLEHLKGTMKYFGDFQESSCLVLLYTEDQLVTRSNEIHWMIYNLAIELNDFKVTAMTFQTFRKKYKKWKKMRCNSPFLVVPHSDNRTKSELEKVRTL